MNGLEMLLGQYWIIRNENKEQYYQVKKELSDKNTLKFIQEVLGWKLIHTEQLIKMSSTCKSIYGNSRVYRSERLLLFMCTINVFRR